ncbi:hypothetical protein FPOAC2_04083 [Fusarium poae]|uniref:RNA-dependent RNA polymerase n=2 Tax=Fusarium poae TaxID=36050 RepID=A0A1B8A841_FUSPO|nr:hypothetical protein FPOAC1_004018 [Fusarium poae]KAG8670784.1 hypothetical protein FPOAC1_004018 [Fusarium poae]OBS16633.1 hypothetical protein FPOA_12750 [Fusarium poae]
MEVFCRHVPPDLSEEGLRGELEPFMQALGISDWACDKPRQKPQAWLKFLHASNGQAFLKKHGKISAETGQRREDIALGDPLNPRIKPRDIARLHILKTAIYAEKSTRALDKHTVAHLKHNHDQRLRIPARDPEAPDYPFWVQAVSCGGNMFLGDDEILTYIEHNALRVPRSIKGKFTRLWLTVWLDGGNRMDFHNETIQDLIAGRHDNSFTLVLAEPPRLYRSAVTLENKNAKWQRVQELEDWGLIRAYSSTCLVYRIQAYDTKQFDIILRSIQSQDVLAITSHTIPSVPWNSVQVESNLHLGRQQFMARTKRLLSSGYVPFAILFQVQALVWNNYINPSGGAALLDLLERVALDAKEKKVAMPITTDAMKVLFQRIPYPCPGTDPRELDVVSIMADAMNTEYEYRADDPQRDRIYGSKIPDHQVWVFKASVTPTRVILTGPDAESRNRVLRMFPDNNDSFLRVTFCDENGQDLHFNPRVDNDLIFSRYRCVMDEGIEVAGRKYLFLGFSHSSLRSHSAWFSAQFANQDFQQQTCDVILGALGDFQDIRVPAKCAARIGQAFSETPYAVPLFENGINTRWIPDVKSADGSRVFSDGVGTISSSALEDIWTYLPMRSAAPTCLQIRWGGCKGMLSLDARLEEKVFCVRRESMMKFPSQDLTELGICDTSSKPLQLVLNRQIIKILEDMGTKDEWFFESQQKALNVLRNVTVNALNTSLFLEHQAIGLTMGLPKLVKQLDRMGINYRRDRFLRTAVEYVVLRELRLLKHKARIPVAKGVTLFGVMDETGFLEEGEAYVTYDKTYGVKNGQRINATLEDGKILVTRSPALHPGDIQVVNMVTPPKGHALRELQNCIIFSQKGKRDLPSQLSGGDLDGDLYNIVWDPQAMPKQTFAPADYPRLSPKPLDRPVTSRDIADFFINFMKTDILGMIATRHVTLADYKVYGTLDPGCLSLASMHSTAVDFSKTGIPVDVKKLPKPPFYRPDFLATVPPLKVYDIDQIDLIVDHQEPVHEEDTMGQAKHKYYRSDKILGRLYRNVNEKKIWDEDIHRSTTMDGPSIWDQLLATVKREVVGYNLDIDWTRKSEQAWKIRNLYESTMVDKMWHFSENPRSCLTEVEVFCGFILNKKGSQTARQRDSSIKLKEEIDRIMTWFVKMIRDQGQRNDLETFGTRTETSSAPDRRREDVIELCWACVAVACLKKEDAPVTYHATGELQSFRVIAACCLLKELNNLTRKMNSVSGGGFTGVGSGRRGRRQTALAIR